MIKTFKKIEVDIETLYDAGYIIIPDNYTNKHPSYKYSSTMTQTTKPKYEMLKQLFLAHGNKDNGLRVGGLKFQPYTKKDPLYQVMCIDIENGKSKTINGNDILHSILENVPEIEDFSYIERSPSGGFHIFYLIPYEPKNLKLSRPLAYDSNDSDKKLLVELLGFNRAGVSCSIGFNDVYEYYGGVDSLIDLDTPILDTILLKVLDTIEEFNQFEFQFDPDVTGIKLLKPEQESKINTIYSLSPLKDFDSSQKCFKIISDLLIKNQYQFIKDIEEEGHTISLFKHPTSEHSHTLSIHRGYRTIWNYSTSDTTFVSSVSYKMSEVYSTLENKCDMLATAKELYSEFEFGSKSGITSEHTFYTIDTKVKNGLSQAVTVIDPEKYRQFIYYLGYRTLHINGSIDIVYVEDNIIYKYITVQRVLDRVFQEIDNTYVKPSQKIYAESIKSAILRSNLYMSSTLYKALPSITYLPDSNEVRYTETGDTSFMKIKSDSNVYRVPYKDYVIELYRTDLDHLVIREYKNINMYIDDVDRRKFNIFGSDSTYTDGDRVPFTAPKDFKFYDFLSDISGNTEEGIDNIITAIGYLLYDYKYSVEAKAVIFVDEQTTAYNMSGLKAGGTGKSLVLDYIKYLIGKNKYININGVSIKDKSQFSFGNVNPNTSVIGIDDLNSSYNLVNIYTHITGDMETEAKYVQQKYIPFDESPKIAITTNYVIFDTSPSTRRRLFPVSVSPIFGDKYTPMDRYNEYFFHDRGKYIWDNEKRYKSHMLGFHCVREYFRLGACADIGFVKLGKRLTESIAYPDMYSYIINVLSDLVNNNETDRFNDNIIFRSDKIFLSFSELNDNYVTECYNESKDFSSNKHRRINIVKYLTMLGTEFEAGRLNSKRGFFIKSVTADQLSLKDGGYTKQETTEGDF